MVSSQLVNSKVLRMAIQFQGIFLFFVLFCFVFVFVFCFFFLIRMQNDECNFKKNSFWYEFWCTDNQSPRFFTSDIQFWIGVNEYY